VRAGNKVLSGRNLAAFSKKTSRLPHRLETQNDPEAQSISIEKEKGYLKNIKIP